MRAPGVTRMRLDGEEVDLPFLQMLVACELEVARIDGKKAHGVPLHSSRLSHNQKLSLPN